MILKNITLNVAICSLALVMGNAASASEEDDCCCCWGWGKDKASEPLLTSPRQTEVKSSHLPPQVLTMRASSEGNSRKDEVIVDLRTSTPSAQPTTTLYTDDDSSKQGLVTMNIKSVSASEEFNASACQHKLLKSTTMSNFSVELWDLMDKDDARANALADAIQHIKEEAISLDVFISTESSTTCRLDIIQSGKILRSIPIQF
jgi:hypothetical protein